MNRGCAVGLVGLVLTAGCSPSWTGESGSAPSTAGSADAAQASATASSISSLTDLRDAYVAAGGSCDQFTSDHDEPTVQGASCDGVQLTWFQDPGLIGIQLGQILGNPYDGPALVGDDWIVYSQDAATLQVSMGGAVHELAYV